MKSPSGFTLIDLLVVITIIGILASVVISTLQDTRNLSIDAKIKSEMNSLAKVASILEYESSSYDSVCGSNGATQSTRIFDIVGYIESFSSGLLVCNSSITSYAASVPIRKNFLCVDSEGIPKLTTRGLNFGELSCPSE